MSSTAPVLGVILAGGENRRYGGRPKALVRVGGSRIADRAIAAMRAVVENVVLVANDPATFGTLSLKMRPDARPGLGVLGGILTAVLWAEEEGCRGALVAACDMPFLCAPLLERIVNEAEEGEAVVPESDSRRGLEPLCAYYGTRCRAAIESALERGDRHVISFFDEIILKTIPRPEISKFGDPKLLFLNVNTPADLTVAEAAVTNAGEARR